MITLENLNENQLKAVETVDKPLLILAGAGSGKTRTIISRIVNILDRGLAWPSQILAITFTNKAAREMRERINEYDLQDTQSMWMSTIHSACSRILRVYADRIGYTKNFKILDSHDQSVLLRQIIRSLNIDSKKYNSSFFSNYISRHKNKGITFEDIKQENIPYNEKMSYRVFKEYEKKLKQMDSMDFDDSAARF